MIDLGVIPRAIQSAVGEIVEEVDNDLDLKTREMIVDSASIETLRQWATTLDILTADKNDQELRNEIRARLNANGSVNEMWFYNLAKRLGFNRDIHAEFQFVPPSRNLTHLTWSQDAAFPRIRILSGTHLPFRSGLGITSQRVYDNVTYGATTVLVVFEHFNDQRTDALINLMLLSRNLGTKMLFYKEKVLL